MAAWMLRLALIAAVFVAPANGRAGEMTIVLSARLERQWTDELWTYLFSAAKGECDALRHPQGTARPSLRAHHLPIVASRLRPRMGSRPGDNATAVTICGHVAPCPRRDAGALHLWPSSAGSRPDDAHRQVRPWRSYPSGWVLYFSWSA